MNHNPLIQAYFQANQIVIAEARDMPLGMLRTLLGVALWGSEDNASSPWTLEDLAERLDVPPSTVSQHTRYLGYGLRGTIVGLDLVRTSENLDNRRKKTFVLTPRGRALVGQIEAALARGCIQGRI
ncbi:hypothetical protein IG197_08955 [Aminobacter sp. SR38]|jgi:DNA-binding MarR family transcriptional regulator|uniref:hypothetical protein n=1 Tax=Aminobacter sp. SR38 TaxID=2774562 RepID=UPI001784B8E7|nr:hypothetical protein [Aminobacter sp. SR38]QOF73161.1 hypothetical protein IG197_08955 [Aminobacter sp. SR38]